MRIDEQARALNPGILRHQITFQRKSVTGQDSFGQDIWDWANVLTCRAQVKALTGREMQSADQRWAEARYKITQHYVRGLEAIDRVAWWIDGAMRYLDIVDIEDTAGTGRVMVLIAKEWKGSDFPAFSDTGNRTMDDVLNMDNVTDMDTLAETA